MPPAVSIVIPCYEAEATIAETIEGVLAQTVTDWECILVSDDGRAYVDILRARGIADPRIREHPVRTRRTGTVAPRNRAMSMATGTFVADLDADDVWKPERLEQLLPVAASHDVCFDILECITQDGRVLGFSGYPDGDLHLLAPGDIVAFDFPFHVIARRDLLGGQWFWDDNFVPDVARTAWLACRRPVGWLRAPLLRYRVSAGSMSQSIDGSRRIDGAYGAIIAALESGAMPQIPVLHRVAVIAGLERKRALNREYMGAASSDPSTPPFLEWVLSTGRSGYCPEPG
jgi:glycosyltransferase involved in cell wall biosynthesis